MPGPGQLLGAMSRSVALPQPVSVLMSMTHVATKATGMFGVLAATCGHLLSKGCATSGTMLT